MAWGWATWWKKPALKVQDPQNQRQSSSEIWSGRSVGPESAMRLAAWWACVRLYAETISTLPLGMFERLGDGSKQANSNHPLYALLHDSPNADQTAAEFWESEVISLAVFGNAYALKGKGAGGAITSLTPLPASPGQMDVKRDERGILRYNFTFRGTTYRNLTEDDVFHIRGFGSDGDVGLSPLSYARQTLGIAEAIAASSGAVFHSGMKSSVFFTSPPGVKLDQKQREDFKKAFIEPYLGGEATNAGLLEYGFDVKTVSINPRDAEMLMSWKFSVEEICRFMRTPPILVGHAAEGQTMWGSGVEQIMLGWLTLGLRPYLTRIEQAIKKRLLLSTERNRFFAEFNVEGLLRADSTGRAALLSSLGQNGYLTRNEGRALDNRPPKEGGDELTVQSNMVPLKMIGKLPPKAVQPAPGEPMERSDAQLPSPYLVKSRIEVAMKSKDFSFKVKVAGDAGEIEGYASVFGVRDSYNEVVMPGAFAESLAKHRREGTKPLMLWQHNPDEPIGVWNDLSDDGKGLWGKGQLLQGVRRADEALIMLKAGAIQGMSIGYREVDTEPAEAGGPRKLLKLDLLEASIVSFPANRRARVEGVKSECWGKLEDLARKFRDGDPGAVKEFEEVLRDAGFPKSAAVQIASVGYAKAIRSESEGGEATVAAVKDAIASLRSIVPAT